MATNALGLLIGIVGVVMLVWTIGDEVYLSHPPFPGGFWTWFVVWFLVGAAGFYIASRPRTIKG